MAHVFVSRNGGERAEEYTEHSLRSVEYTIIGRRGTRVLVDAAIRGVPPVRVCTRLPWRLRTQHPRLQELTSSPSTQVRKSVVDTPRFCILHSRCKHVVLLLLPFFLHSRHDCTRLRFVPISRPHTSRLAPYVSGATQRMINRTRLCRLERRRCRPRVRLTTCTGAVHLLSVPPSVASLAA